MNRLGSNRVGWNARGGTVADDLAIILETGPDSPQWRYRAEAELRMVSSLLGDDYHLWAEMTWPGNTINRKTWREIYNACHAALSAGIEALDQMLTCTCLPDRDACPVCKAHARMRGES
jgi:hypothetical protein